MVKALKFEGWYYKHQANGKSFSVIPGRAAGGAFVLVITDNNSYHISYPVGKYRKNGDILRVGGNTFSPRGVNLNIRHPNLTLVGKITYKGLTPIKGDIMGPFRFFPMECSHGIISMNHSLHGEIAINGEMQSYTGGRGYIESDSGRSFPSEYTWVHCNNFGKNLSIMAAVARIPFYGLKFWGCICVIHLNGREYRLATYKGVKISQFKPGIISLKQGKYRLDIAIDLSTAHKAMQGLPAPRLGVMSHHIRENISCRARFRFIKGRACLFDEVSGGASYECEIADTI